MTTIEMKVHFRHGRKSEKRLVEGVALPKGRIPRISKLMALAIRFDELLRTGQVKNFAELAELGQVSRTRITQIMNLLLLSPEIQERFLPRVERGAEPVYLVDLQRVAREVSWEKQ